jgi:hypothetical protein
MAEILSRKTYKTRKVRVCSWCGAHIEIGTQYERMVALWEDFTICIFHPECARAWDDWCVDAGPDDGWEFYDFKRGTCDPI